MKVYPAQFSSASDLEWDDKDNQLTRSNIKLRGSISSKAVYDREWVNVKIEPPLDGEFFDLMRDARQIIVKDGKLSSFISNYSTEENYDDAIMLYHFQVKKGEWVATPLVEL